MKKVLIFGTFDILHPGHLYFINKARTFGDYIIASVARDEFVKKIKKKYPVNNEKKRIELLLEKKLVNEAVLSDIITGTYSVINNIKPDLICIGYDQTELRSNLSSWLEKNNPDIKIEVIESFSPEKYKSSKIDEHRIFNAELKSIDDVVFMAVDIETTGLNPAADKIVEVGAVLFNKEGKIDTFERYVNPEIKIPEEVIKIHGITDEMVAGAEKIGKVLEQLAAFAHGACPVAHNAYFDIGFLLFDNVIYNIDFMDRPVFDTLTITRNVFPELKSYSLKNIAKAFKMEPGLYHRALSDSILCMNIFMKSISLLEKNNKEKVMEKLLKKNKDKTADTDLSLNWKKILVKQNMENIISAIENKTEIEVEYPLLGSSYSKLLIKPYTISIVKKKYVLIAEYGENTKEFYIDKIRL